MARLGVNDGEVVRVTSRRGSVLAPARRDPGLRPGLLFMACNFPDEVDVNALTIEANDPIAGTAEFKATAVKVEKTNNDPTKKRGVADTIDHDRQDHELATANQEG
jgi:formate dehydrogenase major subunit